MTRLTPREREVFDMLIAGQCAKDIAAALGLSPGTVNFHVNNIYRRIGVCKRAELFAWAARHGAFAA